MSYWDVARIREDFVAVFTEAEDEENKNLWKTFIPHDKFFEFLRAVLDVLENQGHVWLHGPYGTGKTHASFVIKHLLEDDESEIEDYIENLREDIRDKVLSIRNTSRPLVIFIDGASDITNHQAFMFRIWTEIEKKLKKLDLNPGEVFETVKEKLKSARADWDAIAKEYYEGRFSSGEEMLRYFTSDNVSPDEFGYFMDKLSESGVFPPNLDHEDLKRVAEAISSKTDYKRILIIWDEFTSFFDQQFPPVESLQRVVQNIKKPLHFVLITHKPVENIRSYLKDKDSFKKLGERFKYTIRYDMEAPTAVDLIGNVFKKIDKEKWKEMVRYTYSRGEEGLDPLIEELFGYDDNPWKIFEKIFPFHPYTVKILIDLTTNFSSSERSLFSFIHDVLPDFLKTHPTDGWELLTADHVWGYFAPKLRDAMKEATKYTNYFNTYEKMLNNDEKRIFKIVLLLQLFREKVSGFYKKATLDEITRFFIETPLEGRVGEILEKLQTERVLLRYGSEYRIPMGFDIDIEVKPKEVFDYRELKDKLFDIFSSKITREQNRLENRLDIELLPWNRANVGKVPSAEGHKIGILVTIPIDEYVTPVDVKKRFSDMPEHSVVIVVQKSINDIWDELEYYMKDYKSANQSGSFHTSNVKEEIFRIFEKNYSDSKLRYLIFHQDLVEPKEVFGDDELIEHIEKVIQKRFPHGLDKYIKKDPLWKEGSGKKVMENILKSKDLSRQYEEFERLLKRIWNVVDQKWNFIEKRCQPHIPICAMRDEIKKLFERRDEVSVKEIWFVLNDSPFGLYRSPLAFATLGVLMKEYLDYYYRIGVKDEGPMTPADMVRMFEDVIKSGREDRYIKRLSSSQRNFIELVKKLFKKFDLYSVSRAVDAMRNRIKEIGYPIWILKYHPNIPESARRIVNVLSKISRDYSQTNQRKEYMKELDEILRPELSRDVIINHSNQYILKKEEYEKSFGNFLKNFGLEEEDPKKIFDRLRKKMQEEVSRWDEDKTERVMEEIARELEISRKLCEILGIECDGTRFPEDVVRNFKEKLEYPVWIFRYHPSVNSNGDLKKLLDFIEEESATDLNFVLSLKPEEVAIFENVKDALRNFIKSACDVEDDLIDEIAVRLEEKLIPTLEEHNAKSIVIQVHKDISLESLREKIKKKIQDSLGAGLREFLTNMKISPFVMKEGLREWVSVLLDINERSREEIEKVDVEKLIEFLKVLKDEDVVKMYREKLKIHESNVDLLEDEAIWVFVDSIDREEILNMTDEKLIWKFEEWLKEYHENYVKPKLIEAFNEMSREDIIELVMGKFVNSPKMGLEILRMLKEMRVGK